MGFVFPLEEFHLALRVSCVVVLWLRQRPFGGVLLRVRDPISPGYVPFHPKPTFRVYYGIRP